MASTAHSTGARRRASFDPDKWIDQWLIVGTITVHNGTVWVGYNLDGNHSEQQSLLTKVDAFRGRRAEVRNAALRRWAQ